MYAVILKKNGKEYIKGIIKDRDLAMELADILSKSPNFCVRYLSLEKIRSLLIGIEL